MFVIRCLPGSAKIRHDQTIMRILLLCVLIAIVALAIARKVKPATDQHGSSITAPTSWPNESAQLTVATFNVQTGKDIYGKRDIARAAEVIKSADIVGVQEVYATGWLNRVGLGTPQTEALAQTGDFGHLFAATRFRWFRENRGNALLSKIPLKQWRVVMLPDQTGKSFRNMIIAKFVWQETEITLINTHLHTTRGREHQLVAVLEEFAKHPRAILLGDFNSPRDTPLLAEFLQQNEASVVDAVGRAGIDSNDSKRIDWIFTKGFEVVDGRSLEKGVSDHPYYEVVLQLSEN